MNAITHHWKTVQLALAEEKASFVEVTKVRETAFLPAALEVIERPVSPTARVTTWVMLGGLALMLLWLVFGNTDIVASAAGRIIPAENVKLVQPAEAGVVRAILVHEGQKVAKGQPLVTLDPTVSTAETTQARQALQTAELDAARAQAILGALDGKGFAFVPPAGIPLPTVWNQEQLARAQLAQIEAGAGAQAADRQIAAAALSEARNEAAKLSETLPLLDQQIAANEKLLAKGYVSKLRVIEMRRQRLATARDRDIARNTIQRANGQIAAAASGGARTRAEARATTLTELIRATGEAQIRREELVKSERRSSFQQLVAPAAGIVAKLSVHTVGGIIEAGKPIMIVVPEGGPLVAEVKLLNKDVGFVHAGQAVAVKLDAFPFTRYGTVPGRILSVGSDASEDEHLGLVYIARIALNRTTVQGGKGAMPILAGMSATADVKTGQRSFLSYLLSPIEAATMEAGRER